MALQEEYHWFAEMSLGHKNGLKLTVSLPVASFEK